MKSIFSKEKSFFIAEVGQNHQGDLEKAREYIRVFSFAGADAIKFQVRNNKSLFSNEAYKANYNSENAFAKTYGKHREKLELSYNDLVKVRKECRKYKVKFMVTPFDEISLEGLVENKGILYIWNDKDLKSRELEINVRNELGVKQQLVNKSEIHDLEPHIKPFYHAGVYYPYARHARNPKKILLKLFELFLKKGGEFKKTYVQDIKFDETSLLV